MPTRYLKESIKTSDSIDQLTWFEEVLFYRLIVSVDDFGRYDGRASVIKSMLFPLKDNVSVKTIESALVKLVSVNLISVYERNGKRYLHLPSWNTHQTSPRAAKSKYPDPNEEQIEDAEHMQSNCIANAEQLHSTCKADAEHMLPDNRNRKSIIDNRNRLNNKLLPEAGTAASGPSPQPPVIELPLNTGEPYGICREDVDRWVTLYPAIDVEQELRNMLGWLEGNPSRRKTKSGIKRFITSWLARSQNSAKPKKVEEEHSSSFDVTDFFNAACRRTVEDMMGGDEGLLETMLNPDKTEVMTGGAFDGTDAQS